jgi:hypothetical protein
MGSIPQAKAGHKFEQTFALQEIRRQLKPTIYFAGKISKNGWRNAIVGPCDSAIGNSRQERDLFNPFFRHEEDSFYYGGPFFVRCDHGCSHAATAHGTAECGGFFEPNELHPRILAINAERIRRADLVFAYINETDCYGTMIELGLAMGRPQPLAVCLGPDLTPEQRRELWMAAECGTRLYETTLESAWRQFASEFLPLYRSFPRPSGHGTMVSRGA